MSSDRNLLFGILALQMDFVSREGLIQGMNAWVLAKSTSLGQVLQEQGALRPDAHALLEALVAKHLEMHGDPAKSLAALSSMGSVHADLQQIADAELHASLAHVSAGHGDGEDLCATRMSTVGQPTSAGLRFRIVRPHAKGGLGQVSVAVDGELNREVALKEIQERYADDPQRRQRFLLEAEITGGLEHPGVVPVYGLGHYTDGRPYYAMRFVRGDSLKEAIAAFHRADVPGRDVGERALAFRSLLGRFVAMCNALAYAHSRGVLHRDLKPGNVMLGQYGETLVVDWGLAKVVGRNDPGSGEGEATLRPASGSGLAATLAGSAVGTPAFMSPEQAAGRLEELGPASDIYGLGASLYALLTGQPPVSGADAGEILGKVRRGAVLPARQVKRSVPAALEAVCQKALALRPEERYESARALADDVDYWLADEPVSAYREPWRQRAGRWMRRHRTAVTALAAGLLAVLAVGGVAWWLVTEEQAARLRQEARLERAEREKAEERAERTRQAEAELRRAVEKRSEARLAAPGDRSKWNEAFAAVKRAEGLLAGGNADGRLRARAQQLLREMEAETRDRRLLARLDEARLQLAAAGKEGGFDYAGASARYVEAFREDGLDILQSDLRSAARRLKRRAIKAELVAGLDDWADSTPEAKVRHRLLALIAHVDPHPASFRWRWRKARANRPELLKLISAPEVRKLSASDLARLGRQLRAAKGASQAVEFLRQGWARYPGDFWINFELALALDQLEKPPLGEVIRFYTAALAIRPRSATVYYNLGNTLAGQQDLKGAIAAYRKAIDINPRYAKAYYNLGKALAGQQDLKGAIAAYRKAIDINPRYAKAYYNLGVALAGQQDLKGAIAAFRKAIDINPRDALAHNNLGVALAGKKDQKGAIAAYRKAIDINPRDALAYYNLGNALAGKKDQKGAIAAYRKAIEINPRLAQAYQSLGVALKAQQDLKGAIAAYRKAIEINPRNADAYNNLGLALKAQQDLKGAIVAYRKAIEINPRLAPAYQSLGVALADQQDQKGAIAAFRKAIDIDRRYSLAHFALGMALQSQGEFAQALVSFKEADRWLPRPDRRRLYLLQLLRSCQRQAHLEAKLPAVLDGKQQPQNHTERLEYARICHAKQLYAAAARFFEQAFAGDGQLAQDLKSANRYAAACAAARAGTGAGKDAAKLDDKERARKRRQGLAWLRADLELWIKELDKDTAPARRLVQAHMQHWQRDPDLAGIRDAAALAKLPPADKKACENLWADVTALLQKAGPR
jgi:tetratricopeptide (TPR) repeat protein/serine/threonine protein kinase